MLNNPKNKQKRVGILETEGKGHNFDNELLPLDNEEQKSALEKFLLHLNPIKEDEKDYTLKYAEVLKISKGTDLVTLAKDTNSIFYLVKGYVLFESEDCFLKTKPYYFQKGSLIADFEWLGNNQPSGTTLICAEECIVIRLGMEDFFEKNLGLTPITKSLEQMWAHQFCADRLLRKELSCLLPRERIEYLIKFKPSYVVNSDIKDLAKVIGISENVAGILLTNLI